MEHFVHVFRMEYGQIMGVFTHLFHTMTGSGALSGSAPVATPAPSTGLGGIVGKSPSSGWGGLGG